MSRDGKVTRPGRGRWKIKGPSGHTYAHVSVGEVTWKSRGAPYSVFVGGLNLDTLAQVDGLLEALTEARGELAEQIARWQETKAAAGAK